jgi:hypothetical protein
MNIGLGGVYQLIKFLISSQKDLIENPIVIFLSNPFMHCCLERAGELMYIQSKQTSSYEKIKINC